jgi:ABC-2 type transport system permease protein
MIRPFLYDIKKTITSKTVLILIAIILLVSLAIIPFTGRTSLNTQGFSQPGVIFYHDGGYNFLNYLYNNFGDPLPGVVVTVTVTLSGTNNYTQTGVTNSSGLALVSVNAPQPPANSTNYYVTVKYSFSGGSSSSFSTYIDTPPSGNIRFLTSSAFATIVDKYNSSKLNIQIFYAAPYGRLPSGYSVYYKLVPPSFPYPTKAKPFNQSQMTFLADLTSYYETFDTPIPPGTDQSSNIWFELFAPNKTAVESANYPVSLLRQAQPPINVSNAAAFFFSGVLGFFIPLMAIIGSYSSYGKDRITGVLESVLSRPITRRGLATSRFLSTLLAFSLAVIASVGLVDIVLNQVAGSFLPQDYVLSIIAGLVAEVAAFTGLIFLLSHLVKSTGLLLGISIGLFVVLDFFWGLIIFLLTVLLGGTQGSFVALQATYFSYYANPAQFLNLINTLMLQSSSIGNFVSASSLGVTLPAIVLDGVIWAVTPFILFLYIATRRD